MHSTPDSPADEARRRAQRLKTNSPNTGDNKVGRSEVTSSLSADAVNSWRAQRASPTPQNITLPAEPDEAMAVAMGALLGGGKALPASIFIELRRRNAQLQGASDTEIRATLARQVALLEAVVARQMTKAADPSMKSSAADTYLKSALQAQKVLLQVLSGLYQMNRDTRAGPALASLIEDETLGIDGGDHGTV